VNLLIGADASGRSPYDPVVEPGPVDAPSDGDRTAPNPPAAAGSDPMPG
jgi:hypothetical protein